jgi:hypothetical protein
MDLARRLAFIDMLFERYHKVCPLCCLLKYRWDLVWPILKDRIVLISKMFFVMTRRNVLILGSEFYVNCEM